MPLYYIETQYGCGIRYARTLRSAHRDLLQEVIEGAAPRVRLATQDDVNNVRAMGGYIPDGKLREVIT
mgnify:CR=1 FL=1